MSYGYINIRIWKMFDFISGTSALVFICVATISESWTPQDNTSFVKHCFVRCQAFAILLLRAVTPGYDIGHPI